MIQRIVAVLVSVAPFARAEIAVLVRLALCRHIEVNRARAAIKFVVLALPGVFGFDAFASVFYVKARAAAVSARGASPEVFGDLQLPTVQLGVASVADAGGALGVRGAVDSVATILEVRSGGGGEGQAIVGFTTVGECNEEREREEDLHF